MVIVKLMGGLGNQMFQFAAARRLALANQTTLKFDTYFLQDRTLRENFTFRKYELDIFNLNVCIATPKDIDKFCLRLVSSRRIDSLMNYIDPHYKYSENQFKFNPEVLRLPRNSYLEGYFQSEKYFIDYQNQIRKDFTFKNAPNEANQKLIDEISKTNSIAVHIRRGDFVSNSVTHEFHGVCSLSYYYESIKYLKSKINDPVFYIFSDDMNWVKLNFDKALALNFVELNNAENKSNDLRLMTVCNHHIIANSTFSWWGAWLSKNPGKIVIAPQRWFASDEMNFEDVVPENWIKL
jgi:hypothetical protein